MNWNHIFKVSTCFTFFLASDMCLYPKASEVTCSKSDNGMVVVMNSKMTRNPSPQTVSILRGGTERSLHYYLVKIQMLLSYVSCYH